MIAHLWEGGARCFAGGLRLGAAMVSEAKAFLAVEGLGHHFFKKSISGSVRRTLLLW